MNKTKKAFLIFSLLFSIVCSSQTITSIYDKGLGIELRSATDTTFINKSALKLLLSDTTVYFYDNSLSSSTVQYKLRTVYPVYYGNLSYPSVPSADSLISFVSNWFTSNGGGATISGTPNNIVKFATSSTLGNSIAVDTNSSLAVGFRLPTAKFHVMGVGTTSSTFTGIFQNGASSQSLVVRDDGCVYNLGKNAVSTNLAFGEDSFKSNVSGALNVSLGYNALKVNSTGDANVAVGPSSLISNTTGYYNHAIGRDALFYNTTGVENTAIGYRCLYQNTTANDNIAIGYEALRTNTTGNENIAIGYRALQNSNSLGSVAVGLDAGRALTSNGAGVFLGYGAGRFETGSNKLFIDNQSRANEATGRTDALIYGIFDASTSNQALFLNALRISMRYLPTSAVGLTTGDLYTNAGVLMVK